MPTNILQMLLIIMKTIVLSVVFIFMVHQILHFFTDSLTVHKTTDLVSIIEKKYDEIHKTLQDAPRIVPDTINVDTFHLDTTKLVDLPTVIEQIPTETVENISDMKSELELFIQQTQR